MKCISFFSEKSYLKSILIPLTAGVFVCFSACKKDSNSTEQITLTEHEMGDAMAISNIDAVSMGAVPNDGLTDNAAIQAAIDQAAANGGGSVWLTDGDYDIDADVHINLKSNVTLSMAANARLVAKATSTSRNYVILGVKIHDAKVLGGKIVGDRDIHLGTGGEWGMGIGLYECENIRIKNTRISKCWGDGIFVGSRVPEFNAGGPSKNITILKVTCNNNRRQGLSIGEVNGVTVDSSTFSNTNGTAPQDGIDIEPDVDTCQNVFITNCTIFSNEKNGVEINENSNSVIKYITIQNNQIYTNNGFSGYFQNAGHVTFSNNTIYGNAFDHPYYVNCPYSVFSPNTYQ